jgi:hypothetical protein
MTTKVTLQFDGQEFACGCGSCGLIFEPYEGKLSKDSDTHFSFTCNDCLEMNKSNIKVQVGTELIEFYLKKEHGAYYQVGTNGEIGSFHIPIDEDGTPDIENVGEIEVEWENA